MPLTLQQYAAMIEQGIVPEDASVELLDGALVRKDRSVLGEDPMGHSPLHKMVVSLLAALAARINSERRHLQVQLPIACPPDAAPEPDASVVRGAPRDYADRLPAGADVSTVVEVAHSSLLRDREDKLPIYAGAGIPQYVIINLQNGTIEVYEDPDRAAELYRSKRTLDRDAVLELRLPDGVLALAAAELLP